MKKRISQRNEWDCVTASVATLLNIPYEQAPSAGENGICLKVTYKGSLVVRGDSLIIEREIDKIIDIEHDWFDNYDLSLQKKPKRIKPWKYWLGIAVSWDDLSDSLDSHVVVMRGKKVWHDPSRIGTIHRKDVGYMLEITPKATPSLPFSQNPCSRFTQP